MKHPIYNDQLDIDFMNIMKNGMKESQDAAILKTFIDNGQNERHYKAFKARVTLKTQIEYYGCNLIQLKQANEWDEVLSVKTIEKMNVDDLKLPFKAYTIDLKSSEWSEYNYVHVNGNEENIIVCFESDEDAGGKKFHFMFLHRGKNIKDEVDSIISDEVIPQIIAAGAMEFKTPLDAMRESIYKVISISMYMSMFKRDKERCVEVKTVNKKSKRKRIPGHETNVIYLSQPKYTLDGVAGGGGGKQVGLFVVKGHWRSQPYGKREEGKIKQIFIDSFFKGQGSKIMQKTYKV